jgi:glycosyltransferase involved in cell wall biosynthesis
MGKLNKDKYEITLLSTQKKWIDTIRKDLKDHAVHTIVTKPNNIRLNFALAIFKALINKNIDIIHSQGYTAGIITCIVNKIFKVPHIITLHHVFNADQYSDKIWAKYGSIRKSIISYILMGANYIQAVSDDAKENTLEQFPILKKYYKNMIVIKNGIDTKALLVDDGSNTNTIREDENIIIGFLGRYMPEKGFEYIIKLVDKLVNENHVRNIRIVTVGGYGGFIREYKKEIDKRGLNTYFKFHDFVENVGHLLKQFDVLLIPSLGEAGPLVPMEALVCGVPVIAFSAIGLREVLYDTPAIMVEVKNIDALKDAIMYYIDNKCNIKESFKNYIPIAIGRYDSEEKAKDLEKIYMILKN